MVLGDFNIDRRGDALWQAFTRTGLTVPPALHEVRRSIFADAGQPAQGKFYDQIAWFASGSAQLAGMDLRSAGSVDFVPFLYRDLAMGRSQLQYRVSDHYPLWVEFA